MLETVAGVAEDEFLWPSPFTLKMESCGMPNAGWEEKTRVLRLCYELMLDFTELYRAYGAAPLDALRRAVPVAERKPSSERRRK